MSDNRRARWSENLLRYTELYVFREHRQRVALGLLFAIALLGDVSLLFWLDEPKPFFKYLAEKVFEVSMALLLFLSAFWLQTRPEEQNVRVAKSDPQNAPRIPDDLVYPFLCRCSGVTVEHNIRDKLSVLPAIELVLARMLIDRDTYFRKHAGALDIPKVAVKRFSCAGSPTIQTGICSYFDIYFTHHSPDLSISLVSSGEEDSPKSLRQLTAPMIKRHYASLSGENLQFFDGLPNPMGLTGAVRLLARGKSFWLLQKRGWDVVADRGSYQLGFAGLTDTLPDFPSATYTLEDLLRAELCDEVLNPLEINSDSLDIRSHMLGLCVNPRYLYQPEFFVFCEITIPDTLPGNLPRACSTDSIPWFAKNIRQNARLLVTDSDWMRRDEYEDIVPLRPVDEVCLKLMRHHGVPAA